MTVAKRDQGATLLNDVHDFLARFVCYPSDHAHVAHTLWIAHAHIMQAWESTPRILPAALLVTALAVRFHRRKKIVVELAAFTGFFPGFHRPVRQPR